MQTGARSSTRPIICFVDTPAAYPGIESEERGVAEAIALNLREMAMLDVPVIVVVHGEGGSGGALGIAVGDRVLMHEFAIYSVIPPEGCAAILWRDASRKVEAAEALKITAPDLLRLGIIDEIVKEPVGGAHTDPPPGRRPARRRARPRAGTRSTAARRGDAARSSATRSSARWVDGHRGRSVGSLEERQSSAVMPAASGRPMPCDDARARRRWRAS